MPTLSVKRLLSSGFKEVGCWILKGDRGLHYNALLPARAGVYAFGIDGIVQYVGLASKSLRQRIGFYRRPGVSQRTNVRLNEIIRGHIGKGTKVQILIAHPPDHEWNGLRISGAEGLEAGLIREFELPWNMRGARSTIEELKPPREKRSSKGATDRILNTVKGRPGMTELEIAKALYGASAVQQDVNKDCRSLVARGLIERRGVGGRADPYVYYPNG